MHLWGHSVDDTKERVCHKEREECGHAELERDGRKDNEDMDDAFVSQTVLSNKGKGEPLVWREELVGLKEGIKDVKRAGESPEDGNED